MIKLTGINKIYRTNEIETVALENVNLEVNKGEFLSIMGPSGCGKSTLLNILGLLDNPTEGSYKLIDKEVAGLKEKERTQLRKGVIGFVFQSFNLLPKLSALDNVILPMIYGNVFRNERVERATKMLEMVGLGNRINICLQKCQAASGSVWPWPEHGQTSLHLFDGRTSFQFGCQAAQPVAKRFDRAAS